MRNLRRTEHRVLAGLDNKKPTACTWDPTTDDVIFTHGPMLDDSVITLMRLTGNAVKDDGKGVSINIASWDSPSPRPDLLCDSVLNLKFFAESCAICLVLAGGDIVVVREATHEGQEKIEIVGSVDYGIAAAEWSPDDELLAIVTEKDSLLLMTRDFDILASTVLRHEDLQSSKHVSVGWGKSETQFKGRGARALRDPTLPDKVVEGLPSTCEYNLTSISWRGDGAYVTVNTTKASSRRAIRVYSREGVLDGVSEPVDFLESSLSWRPAGNLVTSIRRLEEDVEVIFFERNGLRHGGFALRNTEKNQESLVRLSWNIDSTLLAVLFCNKIQLWAMSNYDYHLKQEIVFEHVNKVHDILFAWHPEDPLIFVSNLGKGTLYRVGFIWHVARGSTASPSDYGAVAVVDGASVKFTPLRFANVPPPLALHNIEVDKPAIDVALWDEKKSASKISILTEDCIWICSWNPTSTQQPPSHEFKLSLPHICSQFTNAETTLTPLQVEFRGTSKLHVLLCTPEQTVICTICLQDGTASYHKHYWEFNSVRQVVSGRLGSSDLHYVSLQSGQLIKVSNAGQEVVQSLSTALERTEVIQLPLKAIKLSTPHGISGLRDVAVTLAKNGSLFVDNECIAKNCTSFVTTTTHVIYTTSKQLLKLVNLASSLDIDIPPDAPAADERCRSIERGGKIVTVFPSSSAVVLQMPRGNLETVFPRALVLAEIRRHLEKGAFKKAFIYCRSHRVDMNFIHDHSPQWFLDNVTEFIQQVWKVEYIDLFLSQLRNEDVCLTMYKEAIPLKISIQSMTPSSKSSLSREHETISKVNRVCEAFLKALRPHMQSHHQNVITAHCCKSPPDPEAGLTEISSLLSSDRSRVDRAIEHICFLVDVNHLYDTALGLYNLNLALLVAQQSQKDPREYLPFLQKLREQSSIRMKFSIDNYLGRHLKCLKHLQDLDSFDEFKAHTIRYGLYEDALRLYRHQSSRIQDLMRVYAVYLSKASEHSQAGIAYELLKDYSAATEEYRLAHKWQEALSCASLVPFNKTELQELASTIADSLVEIKDFYAAAVVQVDYLLDVESAARLFCKGCYFVEAIRCVTLHNKSNLLEKVVDPGLLENENAMAELITDCKAQLTAQVPRIQELRALKAQAPLEFLDAEGSENHNISDNLSIAGTEASTIGASLFTRYTNQTGTVGTNTTRQTSKNKRKEERKRARGKKGSAYEEEYLAGSVVRLFERVNGVNEEIARLVTGLLRRGMREKAISLESAMLSLVNLCQKSKLELFHKPPQGESSAGLRHSDHWTNQDEAGTDPEVEDIKNHGPAHGVLISNFEKLSLLGH